MAGYIENISLPIQTFSDAQASILDFLFPGFTRMSAALQGYLTIDLNVYVPLLCFFGLIVFGCGRICQYLWGLLETYCTSIVYLRYREDAYDMFMLWTSSQSFAKNARSSLVTTDLASSLNRSRNDPSNSGDANKKTLYYTPWNGRFLMRYKGRVLVFRRQYQAGDFSSREEVSISCFGRSPQILKELLSECRTEYTKLVQGKTCLYEHQDGKWIRSAVSKVRRTSTVILDEDRKRELLQDITEFLHPASLQWYSDHDIPYRRGYLLYGPPGTGKSSLSSSIAGHFGLNIYILSLSTINEANLKSLFDKLPSRCIILLEDIDAVSSNRDTEVEDSRQITTGSPSRMSKSVGGKVSLSYLLNVIDGVGSQEGRILIMTTNHITRLDEALIRPGRVDKKVELGLADNKMTAGLFCLVFKPVEGDVAFTEDAQVAVSQREEAERVERLAKGFAVKVPELKFSPAEIFSFFLEYRKSPEEAIHNVEQLISKPIGAKSKLLETSEDIKPEDIQSEIARDPKWDEESSATEVLTEMVQQPAPPTSPNLSASKCFIMLSDAQDLVQAVKDMQIASAHTSKCTCSHTPPEDASDGTSTFCSSTFPTNQPQPQIVTTEHVQQFFDILRSLSTKQEPPPPPAAIDKGKSEEPPARASKLEFKTVNEVWDTKAYKYKIVESITLPDEENELDRYIFVVRTRIDRTTEKQTHHVDIKSEGLRDVLRSVLQDVKGICLRETKPSVEQNLLFHYLSDLEAYRSNTVLDDSTLQHLSSLVDFIKKTYESTAERLSALLEKCEITYDLLWAFFKPNAVLYTTCVGTGKPRCVKYGFSEERKQIDGVEYFYIGCHYLDSDGKVFGEVSTALGIEKFRGTRRINSLGVFPLPYHQKEKETRAYLEKCGRKFLSLMSVHHCHYQGIAFYMKKNHPVKLLVNSRIMVDAIYFREANPNYARASINEPDKESSSLSGWTILGSDDSEKSPDAVKKTGMEPSDVKGDDLLICSPTLLGFSLGNKLWAEFAIDDIRDIEWQPEALSHLQIPQKKKKAIHALLEAHIKRASSNSLSFDDFIIGKGLGFNVLLHGPPGAGKTLTAEVLSEYFQMPLYAVSASELGRTAEELESRLPLIFERASKWNALLLLDEADVFLEQRSIGDINRNALVCVFLRTLEYYQGIVFFTTNRVKQIDDAIASRIHFKIKYDILGPDQRRGVWEYFLKKATTPQGPLVYSKSGLESLVQKPLNGRQIKNLTSTAHALALQEGTQVTLSHLEFAIEAGEDFERDVNGAGSTEAMRGYF